MTLGIAARWPAAPGATRLDDEAAHRLGSPQRRNAATWPREASLPTTKRSNRRMAGCTPPGGAPIDGSPIERLARRGNLFPGIDVKLYPGCYFTHLSIDAALEISAEVSQRAPRSKAFGSRSARVR